MATSEEIQKKIQAEMEKAGRNLELSREAPSSPLRSAAWRDYKNSAKRLLFLGADLAVKMGEQMDWCNANERHAAFWEIDAAVCAAIPVYTAALDLAVVIAAAEAAPIQGALV
jgi:hypothetical protein